MRSLMLLPLLALQMVWQGASDELRYIGSVRHLNGLLTIAAVCWLLVTAIGALADAVIARHPADVEDNLTARRIATQARVLSRTAATGVRALWSIGSATLLLPPGRADGTPGNHLPWPLIHTQMNGG